MDGKPVRTKLIRVDEFVARLRQIPRKETQRIWSICMAELRYLKTTPFKSSGNAETKLGYELTTLRSVIRDYRNSVRAELGKTHPALGYLRASYGDQEDYKDAYNAQIVDDHSNLRPIDCDDLVETAEALLSAPETHHFALAAALALVTGRRGWEIASTAKFSSTRTRPKYLAGAGSSIVLFEGQAKGRDSENAQTDPYEIPVLVKPSIVLAAFDRMHDRYPFRDIGDNKRFNGHVRKEINTFATRAFHDSTQFQKGLTLKDLRAAYATIADTWFAPDHMTMNVFFARILGHTDKDVQTSLSYQDFYPIGHKRGFVQRQRASNREAVSVLEEMRDSEADPVMRDLLQGRIDTLKAAQAKDPELAIGAFPARRPS